MKKGFTMVELIAVVIIMAAMSLVALTSYNTIIKNTEINNEKDIVRSIVIEANMLYNDYVLKDQQDELTNRNIYNLMNTEDKPQTGELIINDYGNVAILVNIEDRCYKKVYDSNQVNLVTAADCNLDYSTTDFDNPIVDFEIVGSKHNDWYADNTYVKIKAKDSGSGILNYKWCVGVDCTPSNTETGNKAIAISDTTGTQVCVIATDKASHTTDKTCTDTIKVDTTSPNLNITTTVNDSNIKQEFVVNTSVATNKSGYSYEWYKDGAILSNTSNTFIVPSEGTYKVRVISGSGKTEEKEIDINTYEKATVDSKVQLTVMGTMDNEKTCVLKGKYSAYIKKIPYDTETCTLEVANNLVMNGNLEYKSNAYIGGTYNATNNEIVITSGKTVGEYIEIDPNKVYQETIITKATNGSSTKVYLGLSEYDCEYKSIMPKNFMFVKNSTTTLAQDLKDGDTVVYLTDASGFNNTTTLTYQLGLIFWNYKDCEGNEYGIETYSQNVFDNLYETGSIDYENNTITLKEPWDKGTIEKGTSLSQSSSGSKNYGLFIGNLTEEYETYTNTLTSTAGYRNYDYTKFVAGTKYIKPYLYFSGSLEMYIKELTFEVVE